MMESCLQPSITVSCPYDISHSKLVPLPLISFRVLYPRRNHRLPQSSGPGEALECLPLLRLGGRRMEKIVDVVVRFVCHSPIRRPYRSIWPRVNAAAAWPRGYAAIRRGHYRSMKDDGRTPRRRPEAFGMATTTKKRGFIRREITISLGIVTRGHTKGASKRLLRIRGRWLVVAVAEEKEEEDGSVVERSAEGDVVVGAGLRASRTHGLHLVDTVLGLVGRQLAAQLVRRDVILKIHVLSPEMASGVCLRNIGKRIPIVKKERPRSLKCLAYMDILIILTLHR
uniref:Uncharacterized protein n=1 Tax=Steinernema glaseri TaxID=37863 RepID=A0A1I7ZCN6_9BILA